MIQRYDLTYDVASDDFAVTPVPESHEGRFVAYEDYESLLKLNESLTKEIEQYRERIKAAEDVIKLFSEAVEKYKERNVPIKEEAWTVWHGGGKNPVPGKMVDVKSRDGAIISNAPSGRIGWNRTLLGHGSDIIAYRVVNDNDIDAWTVWLGGDNPVPGEIVECKLRNGGDKVLSKLSDHLHWGHIGELKGSDIIAYRVVKEG